MKSPHLVFMLILYILIGSCRYPRFLNGRPINNNYFKSSNDSTKYYYQEVNAIYIKQSYELKDIDVYFYFESHGVINVYNRDNISLNSVNNNITNQVGIGRYAFLDSTNLFIEIYYTKRDLFLEYLGELKDDKLIIYKKKLRNDIIWNKDIEVYNKYGDLKQ